MSKEARLEIIAEKMYELCDLIDKEIELPWNNLEKSELSSINCEIFYFLERNDYHRKERK